MMKTPSFDDQSFTYSDTNRDEKLKIIDNDLIRINQESSIYDVVCENWLAMEIVFNSTPFMSRYKNAEEWRSALTILWQYFDLQSNEELKLMNWNEFRESTHQLLDNFLNEPFGELNYLFVPSHTDKICVECCEKEFSNEIQQIQQQKPKEQVIPLNELDKPCSRGGDDQIEWLNDDLLGYVLSFLTFPKEFSSISLTCKRFYKFLHYSTDFSWISNLTFPKDPFETHFLHNLFQTYQGFTTTAFSSAEKLENFHGKILDRRDVRNALIIHNLLKNHEDGRVETNFCSMNFRRYSWFGLGYFDFYWLLKRNKKNALRNLSFDTETAMKVFGMMMILKNASKIIGSTTGTNNNGGINITINDMITTIRMDRFNCSALQTLDLSESGLGRHQDSNIIFSCLPGLEDQYFEYVSYCSRINLNDSSSSLVIPRALKHDVIIETLWVNSIPANLVELVKELEDRGTNIQTLILDSNTYSKMNPSDLEELMKMKCKIEVGTVNSSSSMPPETRWTLKSVIQ